MGPIPAAPSAFDPVRHDSHVIALFGNQAEAELARHAVLATGIGPDLIVLLADADALHRGERHPVQDLFVPEDDYHDYHHALGRGYALIVVQPTSSDERDQAVQALETSAPLDPIAHGRRWRGTAMPVERLSINHANVSRADMHGRAIGGRDEMILDMTGQKMTVRRLSETDMAEAPFAPWQDPDLRPAPLAPPAPDRDVQSQGISYTYGVPDEIVRQLSPDEQVMAQPHTVEVPGDQTVRGSYLRSVAGETRLGRRDPHPAARHVRAYVTERAASAP